MHKADTLYSCAVFLLEAHFHTQITHTERLTATNSRARELGPR